MTLDDNHESVVLACARAIQSILSCDMNENYFNISEVVSPNFCSIDNCWMKIMPKCVRKTYVMFSSSEAPKVLDQFDGTSMFVD
jgi:hypothetical protein